MSDLRINRTTGDIFLSDLGDLELITETEAIRQHLETSLRTFLGEIFYAPEEGMPYFQRILGKNRSISTLTTIFRRGILLVPGVLEIQGLDLNLDPSQRTLSLSFSVRVTGDAVLEFPEFIIDV